MYAHIEHNEVTFGDLKNGELFYFEEDDGIYMKIVVEYMYHDFRGKYGIKFDDHGDYKYMEQLKEYESECGYAVRVDTGAVFGFPNHEIVIKLTQLEGLKLSIM